MHELIALHVLKPRMLKPAPMREDYDHATDSLTVTIGQLRFALRVRRREYFPKYQREITFRSTARYGAITEYHKILLQGWADIQVYGFAHDDDDPAQGLISWIIGDLNILRAWHDEHLESYRNLKIPGRPWPWCLEQPNGDGTAFIPFSLAPLLDRHFAIAHHLPHVLRRQKMDMEWEQRLELQNERIGGMFEARDRFGKPLRNPNNAVCGCGQPLWAAVSVKRGYCEHCAAQRGEGQDWDSF
jgi:hypothetical protein